jgi:uncharacterized membrane protein
MGTNMFLGALEAEWVHKLLLLPVLIIALSSIPKRWLATRNQWLLILASAGFIIIVIAQFHHGVNEVWLTMLGSTSLIAAHVLSLNLTKPEATS